MAGARERTGLGRWVGVLPVVVLVVSAALLTTWWRDLERNQDRILEARFQASARRVATKISERLDAYDTIVRGLAGLFAASDDVTRSEFHAYVDELDLPKVYPGILAVGFCRFVPAAELARHEAAVRAEGFPAYAVRPSGERPAYSSVLYVEPFRGRNLRAFGYDMLTDPVRRAAAETARDIADLVTTERVRLVQETDEDVQPGVVTLHPVYARGSDLESLEGRRRAIAGWVYFSLRAPDALSGIVAGEHLDYRLEVFDGPTPAPDALLFDSDPGGTPSARVTHVISVPVNQRTWTLRFTAGPAYVAAMRQRSPILEPLFMALVALLLTGLTAAAVASYRSRQRALGLARSLGESESRWRGTFEQAPVGIFTVDADDRILHVNRRYCDITGYSPEELIGQDRREIVHPEDREADAEMARKVRKGELPIGVLERRGVRKDGSVFWVEVTFSLDPQAPTGSGGLIGVADDITARHEAEQKFREIAEGAMLGILIVQDDRIVYANPMFAEITGRPLAELPTTGGALVERVVHPDDRARVRADRDVQMRDPDSLVPVLSYRIVRPDGSQRLMERMVRTIPHRGRPATLMTLLDVTDRERTAEELRKAQRLESLGLVAGGIAHDFNNILTAVFGHVELARAQLPGDATAAAELGVAVSALARARDLTRQLLTFATGGAPERRLLDVRRVLEEAARLGLGGSDVRARIELPADLPAVEADEGQLSQLLNNLLVNARQATSGPGEVALRGRLRAIGPGEVPGLSPGRYVEIAVADRGHGIPADVLPRVFDPFFTTRPTGTGLGLATSYSIARRHGGHIAIDSTPGEGTTVSVLLPAAAARAPSVAPAHPAAPAPAPARGLRVLAMDDEPLVLKVAVKQMRRLGFEVETAADGAEAVEAFRRAREAGRPFDLVLLDLTVPGGMGGAQAVQRMREIDPGVVAVACSGYFDAAVMAEPGRFGFAGVLAKPYLGADLERVLDAVRTRVE